MPRPRVRNFTGTALNGRSTRIYCDGRTVVTDLQSGSEIKGLHKDAAVISDGFKATDYSCCWITDHMAATAKWKSSGVTCYDVVGYGPPPYYNPIYRARQQPNTNILPIPTARYPMTTMSLGPTQTASGVITPGVMFGTYKDSMTNGLLNKIKDQKAMALVSLAESKQTVSLARSLAKDVSAMLLFVARGIVTPGKQIDAYLRYAMRNGLRPVKKDKRVRSMDHKFIERMQRYYKKHPKQHADLLKGTAQTASDRWLQYRYGIGPALSDLSAAHDYVYTKWHKFVHRNHIVVKYRGLFEGKPSSYADASSSAIVTGESTILAQYISRFYISNSIARHAQKTGFSPSELAATAWELIPFSFVFDWFYNMGDYISAMSATVGLSHVQTSFSIKETVEATIRVTLTAQNGQLSKPGGPDGKVSYGGFLRRTYKTFPFPVPPTLQFPFDSIFDKRIFDSVALLFGGWNKNQLTNRGA